MNSLVIIADDHPLFRQALRETILPIFQSSDICELESLEEVNQLLTTRSATLLLLDLRMPDSMGLTGLMMVKGFYPELPVIIVSASEEPEVVRAAIQAGASGYIFKSYSLQQIHDAVVVVNQGGVFLPESIKQNVNETEASDLTSIAKISSLTPTQLRIFILVCEGMMNKQIAGELEISEATVKAHITSVYRKLSVRSRTQAVMLSKALDLVNLDANLLDH